MLNILTSTLTDLLQEVNTDINVSRLGRKTNISFSHLYKITKSLAKSGVLTSKKVGREVLIAKGKHYEEVFRALKYL